jgi:hypothetical protein
LGGVQNLIRIRVADAADDSRVSQRAQCRLAADDVQRGAAFGAGFSENQRAIGKIECRKVIASQQPRSGRAPVEPAGDHQMDDQP